MHVRIPRSILLRKTQLLLAGMVCLTNLAFAQGVGNWHTAGNQILDTNNQTVRIAGINWYGFETTDEVVHGLWAQDYHAILNAIKNNGYNTIRLPYSNQMVESPIIPSNISYNNGGGPINTDLKGLNSLEIMDKIIAAAGSDGLRVILVNHRSEAGNSAEANGLWYTTAYPEPAWINDWLTMVNRYAGYKDVNGNPTVIGVDLRNEPHLIANGSHTGACWTGDTATGGCPTSNTAQNWPAAAQRAGNAVLGVDSSLLIIVEGTDCYNGDCDWWGGNLEGVKSNPVVLNVANRLVYSPHDYGPALFQQAWFNGNTSYTSLSAVWSKFWGYISANNIAPVFVGEFGTDNNSSDIQSSAPGSQGQWFQGLVNFLQNNSLLSWTSWALNGEDSYALLDNQYDPTPLSSLKQSMLATIQFPLNGASSCTGVAPAPTGLTATAVSSSQINLNWTSTSPPSGCGITYNVFRSTMSGFTPSASNQISSGIAATSFSDSGLAATTTYYYAIEAVDSQGSSAASSQASAATQSGGTQCTTAPSAPVGLVASAASSSQINLNWTAVTPPANCSVTYNVFASTSNGFTPSASNQIASGLASPSFSNTNLAASTTFYYRVEAVDVAGTSLPSNQASAMTGSSGNGTNCHVVYSIVNQWNTGFQAAINIENTGGTNLTSWILTWTFPGSQQITGLWNGSAVQTGAAVSVNNLNYNGLIPSGGSYNGIGFTANYSGSNPSPTNFSVNGLPCN